MKLFLSITLLILFFCNAGNAQYKKASFLNKTGRIYDLGTSFRLQGGERKPSTGFFFSYGKESLHKRIHHWFDLEVFLGTKFSYVSPLRSDGSTNPVTVTGNSGLDYTFRYNLAYFLLNNSNEDLKVLPYINLSLAVAFGKSITDYNTSPTGGNDPNIVPWGNTSGSAGIGAGVLYKLNSKTALRLSAAYYGLINTEIDDYNKDKAFQTVLNHPAITLGIRFKMERDN